MAPWVDTLAVGRGQIHLSSTTTWFAIPICAISLYKFYQWLLPRPIPGVPYNLDASCRIFGDGPDMVREGANGDFGLWCANQFEKMKSPICQVFVRPFATPWVLLSDFREAQDILTRRSAEFDKPAFLIDSLASTGDFHIRLKTNSEFKARRALKQDLMAPPFLHDFLGPRTHTIGHRLVDIFERKRQLANGRPFSVQADFHHASLDVMLAYSFGDNWTEKTTLKALQEIVSQLGNSEILPGTSDEAVAFPDAPIIDFLRAIHDAPHVMELTTVSWLPKLSHWWWSHQSWYKDTFAHKTRVVPQQLKLAVQNFKAGEVKTGTEHMLMREALQATKSGRPPAFESQSMVDEIFGDLVAGHHTTGASMAWLAKFLTGYPVTQTKLRTALYAALPDAVVQRRPPTYDELRSAKIPYLEACIEEMLRLTPFVEVREATCDTELLGNSIPKGCHVFMVASGPGFLSPSIGSIDEAVRSPTSQAAKVRDTWDESRDLRLFEPERWLVRSTDNGNGSLKFDGAAGPQLGFGLGIRQCWGRKLAHMEIRTIMALVVWNFELLDIPDELGGYDGHDGISRQPKRAFVRLRKVDL